MTALIDIALQPFRVPNYVLTQPRKNETAYSFHLSELSAATLADLCDQFRAEVFTKAKKDDPQHE